MLGCLYNLFEVLHSLSGLCMVCLGFEYFLMCPHPNLSPPGPTAAAAVAQGGAGAAVWMSLGEYFQSGKHIRNKCNSIIVLYSVVYTHMSMTICFHVQSTRPLGTEINCHESLAQ